jgi:hypothetical protein
MKPQAPSECIDLATAKACERGDAPKGVTVPEGVECQGQSPFLAMGANRSKGVAEAGGDSPVSPLIKKETVPLVLPFTVPGWFCSGDKCNATVLAGRNSRNPEQH